MCVCKKKYNTLNSLILILNYIVPYFYGLYLEVIFS